MHGNTEYIIKSGSEDLLAEVKLAILNENTFENKSVDTFVLSSSSFTELSEPKILKDEGIDASNARPILTSAPRSGDGRPVSNNTRLTYGPNRMGNNPHYLPSCVGKEYNVYTAKYKLSIVHAVYRDYLGMGITVGVGLEYRYKRKGWQPAGEMTIKNINVLVSGDPGFDAVFNTDWNGDEFYNRAISGSQRSSGMFYAGEIYYGVQNYKYLTISGNYSVVVDHYDPAYNGENLVIDNYTAYYENVYSY